MEQSSEEQEMKSRSPSALVIILIIVSVVFVAFLIHSSKTIHHFKKEAIERGYAFYNSDREFQWREKQDAIETEKP